LWILRVLLRFSATMKEVIFNRMRRYGAAG
jgi:hypothetical protein